jgi:hypothetical protein
MNHIYRYQIELPAHREYLESDYPLHEGDCIQLEDCSEWRVTAVMVFVWKGQTGSAPALVSVVPL